jgi:hypothetical protein
MRSKNGTLLLTVPGFYVGCLPSQALIQSTMECFYNQLCIDQIQSHIDYNTLPLNVTSLNISKTSRYSSTTSIEEMLKNLFVEQWNSQTYFEQYYNQCQPSVSSITKLTELVGGVSLGIGLIAPVLVKIFLHVKRKFFKSDNTIIPQDNTPASHVDNIQ